MTEALATRYDKAAPLWGDKVRALGYFDAYLGFLSALPPSPVEMALDAGCGTGAFAEALATVAPPAHGIVLLDPSEGMLRKAQAAVEARGAGTRTVRATLGARPGPVDLVLAAHVIEHCPDPAEALADLRAMLRPGGRLYLVLSKPHWCNAIIWLQWRHRTFGRGEAVRFLRGVGFEVVAEHRFPVGPPSRTSRGWVARAV